jgi:hypothetical protein
MSWKRHVQGIREVRNAYKILAGNSEGMRPFVEGRDRGKGEF